MSHAPLFVFLGQSGVERTFQPRPEGPFFAARCVGHGEDAFLVTPSGIQVFPGTMGTAKRGLFQGGVAIRRTARPLAADKALLDALGAPSLRALLMGFTLDQMRALLTTDLALLLDRISARRPTKFFEGTFFDMDSVFMAGGVARTRDAVVWIQPPSQGAGAPIATAKHLGDGAPLSVSHTLRPAMEHALALCGAEPPPGMRLEDALDRFCVGRVHSPDTAHGKLALARRVVEDMRLMPVLAFHQGGDPRPVVPVFL